MKVFWLAKRGQISIVCGCIVGRFGSGSILEIIKDVRCTSFGAGYEEDETGRAIVGVVDVGHAVDHTGCVFG